VQLLVLRAQLRIAQASLGLKKHHLPCVEWYLSVVQVNLALERDSLSPQQSGLLVTYCPASLVLLERLCCLVER